MKRRNVLLAIGLVGCLSMPSIVVHASQAAADEPNPVSATMVPGVGPGLQVDLLGLSSYQPSKWVAELPWGVRHLCIVPDATVHAAYSHPFQFAAAALIATEATGVTDLHSALRDSFYKLINHNQSDSGGSAAAAPATPLTPGAATLPASPNNGTIVNVNAAAGGSQTINVNVVPSAAPIASP